MCASRMISPKSVNDYFKDQKDFLSAAAALPPVKQEAQLMLTTGSTRLAVSRGQQTWYHSTCYI